MKNSRLLGGSIALLFAMLWLPFGQYDFLVENWMKVGTYAVPFLLIGAFSYYQGDSSKDLFTDYRFIGMLMLIAYIIHQFEEHWIDILGNEYAFYVFNNNFILGNLEEPDSDIKPLSRDSIFVINTSLVWLVGAMGIWRSPKHLFPLIAMASIIVVNAFVHILAAIVTFSYNPGLVTSIIPFAPLYIWFAGFMRKQSKAYSKQLIAGLIWAFLAHVIMVGGLLMANWFNLFPEWVYFVLLVIWSLVPLILFLPAEPQITSDNH